MAPTFNFGNALFHIVKTGGPRGFFWRFIVFYLAGSLLLMGLSSFIYWPLYTAWADIIREVLSSGDLSEPDGLEDAIVGQMVGMTGRITLGYFITLVGSLVLWAAFEAAVQRRYMLKAGFSLRLGMDEVRVAGVGFLMAVMLFGAYIIGSILTIIIVAIVGALSDAPVAAGILALIGIVAVLASMIALAARLSAAAALTIRDGRFQFFESFAVTKGRFWSLFGAYGIIWFVAGFGFLFLYVLGIGSVIFRFAQLQDAGSPIELAGALATLLSPASWGPVLVVYLLMIMLYGAVMCVQAGPGALAARNDPRGGGDDGSMADVFT